MPSCHRSPTLGISFFAPLLALGGCVSGGTAFHSTTVTSPQAYAASIARLPLSAAAQANLALPFSSQRASLVADIRREVRSADPVADDAALERALDVLATLPREDFVPKAVRRFSYLPIPLAIGHAQTISDAYIVAVMTAAVQPRSGGNVLDVGTGSGYQAAVLARLTGRVSSIEIVRPLADEASRRLRRMKFSNVEVRAGDGFAGWPEHAPFDAIVVAAGAASVPQPLLDQLAPGGRLVMPIGPTTFQEQLVLLTKARDGSFSRCSLGPTRFVPFTGRGERPLHLVGLYDRTIPSCFAGPVA